MKKIKLFLSSFLVYGLGGIIAKVIPLIMVPVFTRLLPDSTAYGVSDMSATIVSFASALATMGMYDGMYRMFFEKEDVAYKRDICSTTMNFVMITTLILSVAMIMLQKPIAQLFFGDSQYAYLVNISAVSTFFSTGISIVSAPTRMENKSKTFMLISILSPLLGYCVSIPMIFNKQYITAFPVAGLFSSAVMTVIFFILNRKWFSFGKIRLDYLKQMLAIAIPLLPNFLIYWVFNSSDRLMITNILGLQEAGIYAVGAKLGMASQLIYTAFAGGWQYFAFSTMKEKDQVKSNSMVFEYLGLISFACSMFVFALAKPIYELLFEGDYVAGFIAAPYLFLAPLLQMLFQVAANQFLVVKKTWPNLFILSAGAILNVCINLFLIPVLGIEGAAMATLVGYAVSDIICVIVLCKMKLMVVSARFLVSVGLIAGYVVAWRLVFMNSVLVSVVLAIVISAAYVMLYKKDILSLIDGLKRKTQES